MPRTPGPTGFAKLYRDNFNLIWGIVGVLGIFLLWELAAAVRLINPVFVSAPSLVARAAGEYLTSDDFLVDIALSLQEFGIGMAIAIAIGIPLGLIVGWYRYPFAWLNPFISGFYATPRIAFAPLIVIWFGLGIGSKIFLVAFGAVFPILLNTMIAFRTIDPDLMKAARSFKASDFQIFRTVALPASVPVILAGIRMGIGRGLIGVIVGEFYASSAGIGHFIKVSGDSFQSDKLFVGVGVICVMGVGLSLLVGLVERRFDAWRVSSQGREN